MKKFFVCIFFAPVILLQAQNLVPNQSFEDTLQCPQLPGLINYATGWNKPTTGTSDYFNACGTNLTGVPGNLIGWEYAKTAVAYSGISTGTSGNYREYIQAQLTDTLIGGEKYFVSFYVSLADSVSYANNSIGAYLSQTAVSSSNNLVLPYSPQIMNTSGNLLINKNGWTLVADTFIAIGNEKYITIGNFNDDMNSDTIFVGGKPGYQSYYYIDDVQVIHYDSLFTAINNQENKFSIEVFPNPANNFINVKVKLNENEKALFEIYDLLGNKVFVQELSADFNKTISIAELKQSIYYYKAIVNNEIIKKDKIIIIR